MKKTLRTLMIALLGAVLATQVHARERVVELNIGYKTVNFNGKPAQAMAVNDQIPGPTLHFQEGDHVIINVHNHLDVGTSTHWHGLIVPWRMDGVDGVTQPPIPPGGTFRYQFTLHQHGTYWYHSHSQFQEQQGVYGGIIIDPPKKDKKYNRDVMVVLSDWNNANPTDVFNNLKKDGGFYGVDFPMQASLAQFLIDYHSAKTGAKKTAVLNAYKMMQSSRMSVYDISDVAYDAYLLNGKTKSKPWTQRVHVGDHVRLRFVGAGASTFYRVKIPGAKMRMVGADGNDIKPYSVSSFRIAPGETFDVAIKIEKDKPYVIYAESIDGLGQAIGILKTKAKQRVDYRSIKPFLKPKPMMMSMDMSSGMKMSGGMKMSSSKKMSGGMNKSTANKYDKMESLTKTHAPMKPKRIIEMKLGGYMDRYMWFLNDKPFYDAEPIMIQHGQWYRLKFINDTMMNHPMHLHGHWFILRNGHGDYDPKLHTIVVPPGATVVADFKASESGQWFFHCHNMFHMKSGMADIFRYQELPAAGFSALNGHNEVGSYWANELDFHTNFFNDEYEASFDTSFGSDFNKLKVYADDMELEDGKLTQADVDVFYWHLLNQFWAVKGGGNYVYRPAAKPYFEPGIGIEGTFPYFIEADFRTYFHEGATKLDLELSRSTQLTHRFFLNLEMQSVWASKSIAKDDIGAGLNSIEWTIQPYYQLNRNVGLYLQYQTTHYCDKLHDMLAAAGRETHNSSYSVGASFLF